MNHQDKIRVSIKNGQACVDSGDGRFFVAQTGKSSAMASCPMHLMLGALGSCIMLTLDAVAQNKSIPLGDTHVTLDYRREKDGSTRFEVGISLAQGLTEREQKILYRSAALCEVGKILKSNVQIDYHLADQASGHFKDPESVGSGC